ncbi:hypothetical protein S40288_10010 [Stachybotrys chartarum IBT 40288]|nr:hypothetical protein S40288_10010 [Stachybotrys chartarum IBT 40288]
MTMQLGFFHLSNFPPADLTLLSDEDLRANSHAAWGVFCWGVFLTYFSGQPDASNPDFAPNLPIPQCPSVLRSHGRMSESGFSGQQDLMGSTFPALCEFWLLIHNGIGMHYEGRFDAPPETWTSKLADHKFREVISWMNSLSPSLIRAKKSGDHFPIFEYVLKFLFYAVTQRYCRMVNADRIKHLATCSTREYRPTLR